MKRKEFSTKELNLIYTLYTNDKLSMAKIGTRLGVSKTVINRILLEQGWKDPTRDNHVYKADYRKFMEIDTPEKAYWLGFIAADGCVYTRKENATIRIAIHIKDKEHLEKLKKFMNSNVEIKEFINASGFSSNNPTPMCAISFNSTDMAQDFINHGIVQKKSLILDAPKIEEKFYLPYILGYFDGDGSIFKFKNGVEYGVNFTGSYGTISWINKILNLNATIEQKVKGSNTYYIRCGGTNKPYALLKSLYQSVDIHLDRKYAMFKELETVVLNRNIK